MSSKHTCFVVDDDEIDRLTVLAFLEEYSFLEVTGRFDSAEKALQAATVHPPDILFLDVDMPGMSGLELRSKLAHIPACIFITSYPDYAVDAFDREALDFLVKPISGERFTRAMTRLKEYLQLLVKADLLEHTIGADTVFIKEGHTQVKLQLHEIIYLEAMKDYTAVITTGRKHIVLSPLGTLIREQAFRQFIRIHRSYAVQKNFIQRISASQVWINDIALPVGRSYRDDLQALKP